ncbi:MAG: circadian clock protein KaiC [Myxococcaceae bacterium]|nr:circadian clock protein KaiC [Myxococcaceae bacterium]
MKGRVQIARLRSGVEGLDEVLGGGFPEFSFNLIAGGPGCGKTTLAHQLMFACATPERPALYVSILGEPPLKMLRYQQQFSFFDETRVGRSVRFLHLGAEVLEGGLERVLARIVAEVESTSPRLVFVDSFRAVSRQTVAPGEVDLQYFVQRLSLHLASWEATTFLIGEYLDHEADNNSIFTVADGIVWLHQTLNRSSVVRRAHVLKMRGQKQIPGLHNFRIDADGLRVYPRIIESAAPAVEHPTQPAERRATGVAGLDEMLGGGIPSGYSTLVVGPSGSGKTMLSTQFILEGIRRGEPGVIAVFEKRPEEYLQTLPQGKQVRDFVAEGSLRMMYLRPLDLSVEETMSEIREKVIEIGAKRIAIDSLSGFELALAPTFREDFRESLYRMVGAFTELGVTVVMTAQIVDSYTELRLSPYGISFLTDAIVLQRYVDSGDRLTRVMGVVKMRGCAHSNALRTYVIDADGIQLGEALPPDAARALPPRGDLA